MRHHSHFAGLLPALALLCAVPAAPRRHIHDRPDPLFVVFSVAHSGFSYTYGMFRTAEGKYLIDEPIPPNAAFNSRSKPTALDTNNQKRDDHLRGPDYFNVQQYPDITFDSTKCVLVESAESESPYTRSRASSRSTASPKNSRFPRCKMVGKGTGPYGDQRSGFLCQVELKRSEFGMTRPVGQRQFGRRRRGRHHQFRRHAGSGRGRAHRHAPAAESIPTIAAG